MIEFMIHRTCIIMVEYAKQKFVRRYAHLVKNTAKLGMETNIGNAGYQHCISTESIPSNNRFLKS
jgi:hypothetical protein